ncbi:helicase-related protein, partial [Staphylococcus epidermidis]
LQIDPTYSEVIVTGVSRQEAVKVITAIFSEGHIDTLVGTTALLGEGWDAPSVNTLVLASYVGSFMLTNQMRGRAIRSDKSDPQKCANIWHLVCVDPITFD